MAATADSYRVFISYSHEDTELVEKVVKVLEENGLTPLWDKKFALGYRFHEQIETYIAHSHVFLPIITLGSSKRGWVHQEIGYAMALNIPVLPVTKDMLPGEMIQQLQALHTSGDMEELKEQLSREVFENLVDNYRDMSKALFQCAELAEDRAVMMAGYANNILKLGQYGCVRQKGGLSSFHIPDRVLSDPVWVDRYGDHIQSQYHCRCQREERIALQKHADVAGCKLIIDPTITLERFGLKAQITRLKTLLEFLENMPDGLVQIAINSSQKVQENITIVGDWFAAESVSVLLYQGYRQTVFTRHAPSMRERIELFDREINELLSKMGWTPEDSKSQAVKLIREKIETNSVETL